MTDYVKLGAILKEAREAASPKITQKSVAEMLHVTAANVSSWEHGKSRIDIESYIRLCHLYGIDAVSPLSESSDDFAFSGFQSDKSDQLPCDHPEFSHEAEKSPSISDEDEELLKLYHHLDSDDRRLIQGEIRGLLLQEKYRKDSGSAAG